MDSTVSAPQRRRSVKAICALLIAGCGGFIKPICTFAADWNKAAFDARSWVGVLKSLNVPGVEASNDIVLSTPYIAEDGAGVPVTVSSRISNTQMIALAVENNTFPLVASFTFTNEVEPEFSVKVRMKRTSRVKVLVQADGKHYLTSREVKISTVACDPA